jgi:hypothetical protein
VDAFVVKYDAAAGQRELRPHRDGSVFSFNLALNPLDQYEGGANTTLGCRFWFIHWQGRAGQGVGAVSSRVWVVWR